MAGHSKWANTKHRKARVDAKRGKIFSKIAKEIVMAARQGGGDPESNITLRALIQKAKSYNMPSDNIERAVKKGTGEGDTAVLEEFTYEGFAPGGVAVLVTALTDNKNRTVSEVRHAFTKNGGSLAGQGSVAHMFHRKGQIFIQADGMDEDQVMELVVEAGAEDMKRDDDSYEILTDPATFMNVVDALDGFGIVMGSSELVFIADSEVPVSDESQATSLIRFIDALEDLEDVQSVYANFNIDDHVLEALEAS